MSRQNRSEEEERRQSAGILPNWMCTGIGSRNVDLNNNNRTAFAAPTVAMDEAVEIQFDSEGGTSHHHSPWNVFHAFTCTNQTTLSDTSSTCPSEENEESTDFFAGYINSMESFLAVSQERTIQKYENRRRQMLTSVNMTGMVADRETSMETLDTLELEDDNDVDIMAMEEEHPEENVGIVDIMAMEEDHFEENVEIVQEIGVVQMQRDEIKRVEVFQPHVVMGKKQAPKKKNKVKQQKLPPPPPKKVQKQKPRKVKQPKKKEGLEKSKKRGGLWWKVLALLLLPIAIYVAVHFATAEKDESSNGLNSSSLEDNGTSSPTAPAPTVDPTTNPSPAPTEAPSSAPTLIRETYVPGKLTVRENGLRLSEGLKSRIIARAGQRVNLSGLSSGPNGPLSSKTFHMRPDGAAVFAHPETGGWAYVSNAEVLETGGGGVGALYFDKNGDVMEYRMLLEDTTHNCAGGKTPWNTWISCEEFGQGSVFQVDPFGTRPPEETTLGIMRTGAYESFAYDIRNENQPRFFVTEDAERGALRRFTTDDPNWDDPWNILHSNGIIDYLLLSPIVGERGGTFSWTTNFQAGRANAQQYYQHTEGIDVSGNELFVVSKNQKELFILDLDAMTYEVQSTVSGVFDGMPDQMQRLVHEEYDLLYFCEEGGRENGIHARDTNGWFFTILESAELNDETTGLDFSPDGKHMYVAFQENGLIFDITREDGLPFHGRTLDVKYHELKI